MNKSGVIDLIEFEYIVTPSSGRQCSLFRERAEFKLNTLFKLRKYSVSNLFGWHFKLNFLEIYRSIFLFYFYFNKFLFQMKWVRDPKRPIYVHTAGPHFCFFFFFVSFFPFIWITINLREKKKTEEKVIRKKKR